MNKLHDVLILGAGGLATQCLGFIKGKYKTPAFFDEFSKEDEFYNYPLYHNEEIIRVCEKFVILVSNPEDRKKLFDRFRYKGVQDSIISPDFLNIVKQKGNSFWRGVILGSCIAEEGIRMGSNCLINTRCSIHHGTILGENVTLAPNVVILGNCNIGSNTFIGAGSVIKEGTKIGTSCIIGMGSIVLGDIPDNSVAYGNPCKVIRKNK